MRIRLSWFAALAAGLLLALTLTVADTAGAEPAKGKFGGAGAGTAAGPALGGSKGHTVKGPMVKGPIVHKPPVVGISPKFKAPPHIAKPKFHAPKVKHAHRPWRPGLKWRWIVVPTIIIAEDLDWCHYHRYRVAGMRFHKHVECHRHDRWDHPSIRYVTGY